MKGKIPLYQDLVTHQLLIKADFLDDYKHIIWDRFTTAYKQINERADIKDAFSQHRIFGINQCVHIASGVVLLASETGVLQEAMKFVEGKHIADDPTTALTIATLYYLVKDYLPLSANGESDKLDMLDKVCFVLDDINWLIGKDGIDALKKEVPPSVNPNNLKDTPAKNTDDQ